MNRRRLLRSVIVLVCLGGLLFTASYEPTHIVRGLLRNETFFRGYPTSYWREVLRADGRAGTISEDTLNRLRDGAAVKVLLECVADSDPDVRWPSVCLLQQAGSAREVEPVLRLALDDADTDVRFQAIHGLARMKVVAMPAVPKLIELSKSDDLGTRYDAEYALWEIDWKTAPTIGGWREFTSEKWGFSVTMPGSPEEEDSVCETAYGQMPIHWFGVSHGVPRYTVAVLEYSSELVDDCPLQDRFDLAVEEMLGGTLVRYDPVEQHGHLGREKLVEVKGKGTVCSRVFPVGRRAYQVQIATSPDWSISPNLEKFFLDSLRITYSPDPAVEETNSHEDL